MKKNLKIFGIYLPIYLLVTIAAVSLRSVACFVNLDDNGIYFGSDTLISIANYTVIALSLFSLSYAYSPSPKLSLIPSFTSPETYVPTGAVGVALLFTAYSAFVRARDSKSYVDLLNAYPSPDSAALASTYTVLAIISLAVAILALLSIAHFVLTATVEEHSSTRRANLGLFTVILLALYAIYLYFSPALPINAPNKIVDQMAYIFASIFFLYEVRISLGRAKWRAYIAFGFIASSLTAYSSIPTLIYYAVSGKLISNNIYETALTLSLFIFITARVLLTASLLVDIPSKTADALIQFSQHREEILNPAPVIEAEEEVTEEIQTDENQINIFDTVTVTENEIPEDKVEGAPLEQEDKAHMPE